MQNEPFPNKKGKNVALDLQEVLSYCAGSYLFSIYAFKADSHNSLAFNITINLYYCLSLFARFAVSFARVYEVTGNLTFLQTAEDMYTFLWDIGWDTTMSCSGGMWFGSGHGKKITITNAQMVMLGAKMYR